MTLDMIIYDMRSFNKGVDHILRRVKNKENYDLNKLQEITNSLTPSGYKPPNSKNIFLENLYWFKSKYVALIFTACYLMRQRREIQKGDYPL